MNLSASSVSTYQDCHLQWYFKYVEVRPEPVAEYRETGKEVHSYAEMMLKGETPVGVPAHGPEVTALFDVFLDDILPTYGEPVLVEEAFVLDVDGVEYTGFIDSVDLREPMADDPNMSPGKLAQGVGANTVERQAQALFGQTILRDLKTSKSRPKKGRYRDALVGYWQGARELGYQPDAIQLDYIVKTKKPYYWPEVQEVPTDDEIDIWVGKVLRVAEQIEEGDWEATGVGSYVCASCPWKDICGPYERWKDMTSPIREEAR